MSEKDESVHVAQNGGRSDQVGWKERLGVTNVLIRIIYTFVTHLSRLLENGHR